MVPVVVEQIRALKRDYDCMVTTLVADNENKMSGTRREVVAALAAAAAAAVAAGNGETEPAPLLDTYGCSSHLLHLCGKHLAEKVTVEQVTTVAKCFRRWNSVCDMLAWFNTA